MKMQLVILSPQAGMLFLLASSLTAPPLSLNHISDSHADGKGGAIPVHRSASLASYTNHLNLNGGDGWSRTILTRLMRALHSRSDTSPLQIGGLLFYEGRPVPFNQS